VGRAGTACVYTRIVIIAKRTRDDTPALVPICVYKIYDTVIPEHTRAYRVGIRVTARRDTSGLVYGLLLSRGVAVAGRRTSAAVAGTLPCRV